MATLVDYLLDYYLAATLLLTAALVACRLLQQASTRLAVAWAATGALLLLVILAALPDSLRVSLRPRSVAAAPENILAPMPLPAAPNAGEAVAQAQPPALDPPAAAPEQARAGHDQTTARTHVDVTPPGVFARIPSWRTVLLTAYFCGAAGVLIWQILGYVELRRVCRHAQPADPRLRWLLQEIADSSAAGPVRLELLIANALPSAAAVGVVRPKILLPRWLVDQATDAQLKALLAHEWAHVRNRDLWLLAAHRLLLVLLYAHPLHALLRRTIRDDQELVADAAAAAVLAHGDYAELLLRWSTSGMARRGPRLAMSAGLWERPSRLAHRITALVEQRVQPLVACSRRWRWAAAAAFAVAALGLSSFTLRPGARLVAAPPQERQPQQQGVSQEPAPPRPTQPNADAQPKTTEPAADPGATADHVVTGRVLGPDGQPHAGAKLYAIIGSNEQREPVLKDPKQPPFEIIERPGKPPLLKVVHPEILALLKKLNHDATIAADDPFVRSPEFERGMADLLPSIYSSHPAMRPTARAISGDDGAFRFTLRRDEVTEPFEKDVTVVALAPPLAPAWSVSHERGALANLQLRLAEDTPIHGQIVDHTGQPVAGASVQMGGILGSPDGTIDFWKNMIDAYVGDLDPRAEQQRSFNELHEIAIGYQFPFTRLQLFPHAYTTDADGRFTITGVGKNRVVFRLQVSSPNQGSDTFSVAAISDEITPEVQKTRWGVLRPEYRTYGGNFRHTLGSEQIIEGTVTDAQGKPVPNVQVDCWSPMNVWTLTDENGKYRLTGLSRDDSYRVQAWPWGRGHQPYLNLTQTVDGTRADGPLTADFKLIRGVVLRGTLATPDGRPYSRAQIFYASLDPAVHLGETYYPGNPKFPPAAPGVHSPPPGVPSFEQAHTETARDGSYELVVLPGPGVLGIFAGERFPLAQQLIDDPELKKYSGSVPGFGNFNFNSIESIDVPKDAVEFRQDLKLDLQKKSGFTGD